MSRMAPDVPVAALASEANARMARAIPREMKNEATSVAHAMSRVAVTTAGNGQILGRTPPSRG